MEMHVSVCGKWYCVCACVDTYLPIEICVIEAYLSSYMHVYRLCVDLCPYTPSPILIPLVYCTIALFIQIA